MFLFSLSIKFKLSCLDERHACAARTVGGGPSSHLLCLSSAVPATFQGGSCQLTRFHFCKQPEHSISRVQVPLDLLLFLIAAAVVIMMIMIL